MSFKGSVEVQCPNGCAPFETHVWSMIRLDKNPELRDQLLSGQLNLLVCQTCHRHFYYDQTVVIHDPRVELLAFVFPEYSRAEAEKWTAKMNDDYAKLQAGLGAEKMDYPPRIFFGLEELRHQLDKEDNLTDEIEIAKHLAKTLKLDLYPVKPSVARELEIPRVLPSAPSVSDPREAVLQGLERVLKENSYLAHFQKCLTDLRKSPDRPLPPSGKV